MAKNATNILGEFDFHGRWADSHPGRGGHGWKMFCLVSLWFSLEYMGLGPFSYIPVHDIGDSAIPRYLALTHGTPGWGSWFPQMGCGVDRLANDLLFPHVLTLLFNLFPGWVAFQLFVLFRHFLSGYFTYRLAKDLFGLGEFASIYAGAAYAFWANGLMSYQLGFAGFPLILWALEKVGTHSSPRRFLWALFLGIAYSFSSSLAWTLPFALIAGAFWFFFLRQKRSPGFLFCYFLFCSLAVSVQIFTGWAYLANGPASHRADWGGGPPDLSLNSILSFMDYGISFLLVDKTSLVFALAGIALTRGRNRSLRILWVFLLLSTVGVAVLNFFKLMLGENLGFLRGYQFDRFYELAPLFAALGGALGLHLSLKFLQARAGGPRRFFGRLPSRRLIPAFLLLSFLPLFFASVEAKKEHFLRWLRQGSYQANYASPILRTLAERKSELEPFRVVTMSDGILHPAYANACGLESADGYMNLYPKTYQKFWSRVIEPLTRQDERIRRYFEGWGSRVYLFKPKLKEQKILFSRYYRLNLLSLANTKYVISRVPLDDANLLQLIQPVFSEEGCSRWEKVRNWVRENFEGRDSLYLYENKACFPRFYLTKHVRAFPDLGELVREMGESPPEVLRDTVFLENATAGKISFPVLGYHRSGIKVKKYSPDRIELSLEIDGPAVLVASNSYSPFWKCRVDGSPRDLFRANGTFWGVQVEREDRRVLFYYAPPYRVLPRPLSFHEPENSYFL